MLQTRPKKMLNLNILEILKKYTDVNHPMSQSEIRKRLAREYDMDVDRKAVKANLTDLMECDENICQAVPKSRMVKNKKTGELEQSTILTSVYYEHPVTEEELRVLVDSVLFSPYIPPKDRDRLIAQLEENLASKYFAEKKLHNFTPTTDCRDLNKIFYTIYTLDLAMTQKNKVVCYYDHYGLDKKLHHNQDEDGNLKEYILNPYSILMKNGHYYVMCNREGYDDVSFYRLDRISEARILEGEKRKPKKKVKGLENGNDIPKHLSEHIYMFGGEAVDCVFEAPVRLVSDIMDYFGDPHLRFVEIGDGKMEVHVKVVETDMECWAMQYATQVRILRPKKLADTCTEN